MNDAAPRAAPLLSFDFVDAAGRRARLDFAQPVRLIVAHTVAAVRPALRAIEQATAAGYYAAGYLAYEAAPAFDPHLVVRAGTELPLLWFGIFNAPQDSVAVEPPGSFQLSDWQPSVARAVYEQQHAAVRAAIARGDTYQVNYSFRLRARFVGADRAFYRQLCAAQQADYCAYLDTGRFRILSAAPELFFRWHDGQLVTRPMKGTARRGRWPAEDEQQSRALATSAKERAENIMIVDLLRNDLGRIARTGSVHVRSLCAVERYPTLFQMTSTVTAETPPATTLTDVLAALFPCGSVTGAPKVSTMQLIAALEDTPRGVYCGTIGYVQPGGAAVFNVAIRTVVLDTATGTAEYGVGGGITWDSTAAGEYAEAHTKAAVLAPAQSDFALLETLRLEHGRYALLERHLDRLADSASYFGRPLQREVVRAALAAHARTVPTAAQRVRLTVGADGRPQVESQPVAPLPAAALPLLVALARTPVAQADVFLYHKTTRRAVYEVRRAEWPAVFDVLLWNEAREVTEFTTGNLVLELDGTCWTPARTCGLLAGTQRAELLARGMVRERVVTLSDLARAQRLWFVNSVRGCVPVRLLPADESAGQGVGAG